MSGNNDIRNGVSAEFKVIPAWAWTVAICAFACLQLVFDVFLIRQPAPPPHWAIPLLGLLAGLVLACFVLLIGYINRDAKRRGMSPLLWTIVAIIIPNALGILLYFVLRQPVRAVCPQCGNAVETGFAFCPHCSCKLSPSCSRCQRLVGVHDAFCPYCGNSLQAASGPESARVAT